MNVPISTVDVGPEAEALVLDVLRSGRLVQGPMVERLEGGFAELAGTRHAIAVSSGTTALVAALEALGVGPGDEVLTSPFTFVATLNAILERGATATFVDIGEDFTINPAEVEAQLTPRTRVLMPVHLYGLPADMAALGEIASAHGVATVEDACQAHGATVRGQAVGSFGVGCFSLYATKNLTTGEGGMITCDDDEIADRLRLLRNQGMRRRYEYELPGHNYRLTDIQAAIAIPQLSVLAQRTAQRRENAARLSAGLEDVPGLVLPSEPPAREHVWHQYTIRVLPEAGASREHLATELERRGVATGVYYPRVVFDYECYREHPSVRAGEFPNARRVASEVLSLPVHPGLGSSEIDHVVAAVREVLGC